MKVQSVGNYDCQRKKDVNFKAVVMKRDAFNLLNILFPNSGILHSVRDKKFSFLHLSGQAEGFRNLYLTTKELEQTEQIARGTNSYEPYEYLLDLRTQAMSLGPKKSQTDISREDGIYTVQHIIKAIKDNTFWDVLAFKDFPKRSYDDLKRPIKRYWQLPKRLLRAIMPPYGNN